MGKWRGGTKDLNHDDIAETFEQLGCSVLHTHEVGGGFPDMVIGLVGITVLVEIKNPDTGYGKAGLTKSQRRFGDLWRGGRVHVVMTKDQAIDLVRAVRAKADSRHMRA